VRDRNVFQGNVKFPGALEELAADTVRDLFTLRDQLGGVELRDDGLEDFVSDRGKDTLIVVLAKILWWGGLAAGTVEWRGSGGGHGTW